MGCGDGRILRHFRNIQGIELIASDARAETIDWCKKNLPGPIYHVNSLTPALPFLEPDSVDFAYAVSVFTHIPVDAQKPWLEELNKSIRPGGYLFITVMNDSLKNHLSTTRLEALEKDGALEITGEDGEASLSTQVGGSAWDVYQSRENIRQLFGTVFEVTAYLDNGLAPEDAGIAGMPPELGQDLVILQKPR